MSLFAELSNGVNAVRPSRTRMLNYDAALVVSAAALLLLATGLLAGALLVPMNAVLQQRGASLMRPGVSVAVQNFLENGLSLGFLALYGLGIALDASLDAAIYVLGAATIVLVGLLALGQRDVAVS